MITKKDITQKLKSLKTLLVEKQAVKKIGFFGSYATDNATEKRGASQNIVFA